MSDPERDHGAFLLATLAAKRERQVDFIRRLHAPPRAAPDEDLLGEEDDGDDHGPRRDAHGRFAPQEPPAA